MNQAYQRIVIFLMLWSCLASYSFAEPFTVALILPKSGDAAAVGASISAGFSLGLEDAHMKDQKDIRVVEEDDKLEPKLSVMAFQKLFAEADKPDVVITVGSTVSHAIKPLALAQRVPHLGIIASDRKVAEGSPYSFTFYVTTEVEAQVFFDELQRRGISRYAIALSDQEGTRAIASALASKRPAHVTEQTSVVIPLQERDFKGYIPRFLRVEKDIDGLLFITMPPQTGILAKQLRALGFKKPFFSIESFDEINDQKLAQGALDGAWYVAPRIDNPRFRERFINAFPGLGMLGAPEAYDLAGIVAAFLKSAGNQKTSEAFVQYLKNIKDYNGALGTFSSTGDNRFSIGASIAVVPAKHEP